eukprot:GHVU01015589.1.p1 GENE.GHVU01015589.1~~GHVU01015589.1.p1  ORF type:complete len:295 (-),score=37.04 GHVU01015589.1:328-1212(-)
MLTHCRRVKLEGDKDGDASEGERHLTREVVALVRDEVNDFATTTLHFAKMRFVDCLCAPRRGKHPGFQFYDADGKTSRELITVAGECFDLRKLCSDPCPLDNKEEALQTIHAAAARGGVDVPDLETLQAQLQTLQDRLTRCALTTHHRKWHEFEADGRVKHIRSGTVIMKDLLTDSELFSGLGDILYMFVLCALKTSNESVLESVNSIISMHADATRSPSAGSYEAESFIHWNGPPLAKADGVITCALDRHFKGKPWHFSHISPSSAFSPFLTKSKVMQRLLQDQGRLPFLSEH